MSRKPSGSPEAVQRALEITKSTESTIEIRRALAVVLPVMHGLSLKETAELVGRSEVWVAKERRNFIREQPQKDAVGTRGGRRNQLIPADEEDAFMEMVCERYIRIHAQWRSIYVRSNALREKMNLSFVEFVHAEIEQRIQRRTTRTTVYNLLARTGTSRRRVRQRDHGHQDL